MRAQRGRRWYITHCSDQDGDDASWTSCKQPRAHLHGLPPRCASPLSPPSLPPSPTLPPPHPFSLTFSCLVSWRGGAGPASARLRAASVRALSLASFHSCSTALSFPISDSLATEPEGGMGVLLRELMAPELGTPMGESFMSKAELLERWQVKEEDTRSAG